MVGPMSSYELGIYSTSKTHFQINSNYFAQNSLEIVFLLSQLRIARIISLSKQEQLKPSMMKKGVQGFVLLKELQKLQTIQKKKKGVT